MSDDDRVHPIQTSAPQHAPTRQSVDPENNPDSSFDDPPDGGKGWIVVIGSALALFSTTGIINAYVSLAIKCHPSCQRY